MMQTYKVTVRDCATYNIRTESQELAESLALDWFAERNPTVSVEITDEPAEVEYPAE